MTQTATAAPGAPAPGGDTGPDSCSFRDRSPQRNPREGLPSRWDPWGGRPPPPGPGAARRARGRSRRRGQRAPVAVVAVRSGHPAPLDNHDDVGAHETPSAGATVVYAARAREELGPAGAQSRRARRPGDGLGQAVEVARAAAHAVYVDGHVWVVHRPDCEPRPAPGVSRGATVARVLEPLGVKTARRALTPVGVRSLGNPHHRRGCARNAVGYSHDCCRLLALETEWAYFGFMLDSYAEFCRRLAVGFSHDCCRLLALSSSPLRFLLPVRPVAAM